METEAFGPIDTNIASGGLSWRLNVHSGPWQQPAGIYRDWMEKTWEPGAIERADWVKKVRLAVSWCPSDISILTELSKVIDPSLVLLHVPNWRSEPYDENYPTFRPSVNGKNFIKRAQKMGFNVMPHCNSIDMDPTHPAYSLLRDFAYRALENKRIEGWTYDNGVKPVQESNAARLIYRDKKTMVKIHPGLAMWRSILAENVKEAVDALNLDAVFLDVTLNTWNLNNCLVENQTPTEGMMKLIEHVAAVRGKLAMGGEGRNEMTMQKQCFGQVHLFKSYSDSFPGLKRCGKAAVSEFLFGKWCRSFGYSNLSGKNAESTMRVNLHLALGAIPTICVGSGKDIAKPNKTIKKILNLAK